MTEVANHTGILANRISMQQHILYADTFVNNSIDVQGGQQDRINSILSETFQLTVRQHIYGEDEDDELDDFHDEKVDSSNYSPFKQAKINNGKPGKQNLFTQMSRPLKLKNDSSIKPTQAVRKNVEEQLSQIDEEEEKRLALAFNEVKNERVYSGNRKSTMTKEV